MTQHSLEIEIAGIEAQLKVVKAELKKIKIEKVKKPFKFADLYGIWKGKVDVSYDDIKNVEFKIPSGMLK